MTALLARGVGVELGGRPVLHDVDLTAAPGRVLGLVGPNGAGKSSLLGALAGDVPVATGTVHLGEASLPRLSPREQARLRAVLPQRTAVSFSFTVGEVVAMGRAPWAGTAEEDRDDTAVAEAMVATDVAHLAHRSFSTLSGGEQARVAAARVLAQSTPVVLMDEPTAALDLRHVAMLLGTARERARAGGTVVVVLHDLTAAAQWCDDVVLLDRGRVAAVGPPEDVMVEGLLGEVYGCAVDVVPHPRTGSPVVLPR